MKIFIAISGYLLSGIAFVWLANVQHAAPENIAPQTETGRQDSVEAALERELHRLDAQVAAARAQLQGTTARAESEHMNDPELDRLQQKAYEEAKQIYLAENPEMAAIVKANEFQVDDGGLLLMRRLFEHYYRPVLVEIGVDKLRQDQIIADIVNRIEEDMELGRQVRHGEISPAEERYRSQTLQTEDVFKMALTRAEYQRLESAKEKIGRQQRRDKFVTDLSQHSPLLSQATVELVADTYMEVGNEYESNGSLEHEMVQINQTVRRLAPELEKEEFQAIEKYFQLQEKIAKGLEADLSKLRGTLKN